MGSFDMSTYISHVKYSRILTQIQLTINEWSKSLIYIYIPSKLPVHKRIFLHSPCGTLLCIYINLDNISIHNSVRSD